jgi:hypothetical protein
MPCYPPLIRVGIVGGEREATVRSLGWFWVSGAGSEGEVSAGIAVAKALSWFYPVFEELAGGMPASPEGLDGTARFLADGQYRNPGGDPAYFTTSYFHRPEELADELRDAGLAIAQAPAGN